MASLSIPKRSQNLPQEIVDEVIDYFKGSSPALKTCSLVHPNWLHRARTHLFGCNFTFPPQSEVDQWEDELDSGVEFKERIEALIAEIRASPSLVTIVTSLTIDFAYADLIPVFFDPANLRLFSLFPFTSLRKILLKNIPRHRDKPLSCFQSGLSVVLNNNPALEYFAIENSVFDSSEFLELMCVSSNANHDLHSLSLGVRILGIESADSYLSSLPPVQARPCLNFLELEFDSEFLVYQFLAPLLKQSSPYFDLQVSKLSVPYNSWTDMRIYERVAQYCGPTITYLKLSIRPIFKTYHNWLSETVLDSLVNLVDVEMYSCDVDSQTSLFLEHFIHSALSRIRLLETFSITFNPWGKSRSNDFKKLMTSTVDDALSLIDEDDGRLKRVTLNIPSEISPDLVQQCLPTTFEKGWLKIVYF
ncbi:hypothetical protein VKT23_018746 [Stygiomarasmius scandens]|uniref:F-box domain-containing protein n=1 Tax=Marasmiellus scandens TaxID=2682957 RepID=A0ABR1IRM9_9AGAR